MKSAFPGSFLVAPPRFGERRRSQEVTAVWLNPTGSTTRRFSSVFILALTPNPTIREMLERDLAAVAHARGLKSTRSIDLYPASPWDPDGPTPQQLWNKIKEMDCDAIYTLSLLSVKSDQRYVPHAGPYSPLQQHSCYGCFDKYIEHVQPVAASSGYYTGDDTYFLEGNVFVAATGEIQWSMQSIAFNPANLECISREYALLLVDQLNKTMEM